MSKKEARNILITGGAGFIGSHVAEELVKKNEIFIVDNLSTGYKKLLPKNVKFFNLDIRRGFKIVNVTFLGIKKLACRRDEHNKLQKYLAPTIMHNT